MGEAHRRFTAFVNARARTTGHLFQGRFASFAMDDDHFLNALRYLAFNPVRAGLAASPEAWPWSSVRAHLAGATTRWSRSAQRLSSAALRRSLGTSLDEQAAPRWVRDPQPDGFPLGAPDFIARVEMKLGHTVRPGQAGRKPHGGQID